MAGRDDSWIIAGMQWAASHVGYRVQMSDPGGNAINQTVIRAAYTHPPAS